MPDRTSSADTLLPDAAMPAKVELLPAGSGRALTAAPQAAPPAAMAPAAPKRSRVRSLLLSAALLGAIGVGGHYGWNWYAEGRFFVSTDDAYVRADTATIAAKVAGYLTSVPARDNAQVKAGDLLARIDDGDYRLAVDAAQRKMDTQDATIARMGEQVAAQGAAIDQAQAQLVSARADAQRASADYDRATKLLQTGAGMQQRVDQALADRDRTQAAIRSAEAAVASAQAQRSVLGAQKGEAEHARAELANALERAQRDLSFTEIRAPFDGVVGNRAAQPGQYAQPGTRLLALIPTDSAYVEANFKETQLVHMKPGQKVAITVDALSDRKIEGTVESFAPATGSQFSLLPPENATGNFTKIVQRVPVRIAVPADVAAQGLLRAGLSVTASVDTRDPNAPRPTLMGALGLTRDGH